MMLIDKWTLIQVSDVILTQVSKCMVSGAIGDPGETMEDFIFSLFYVNHEHDKCL